MRVLLIHSSLISMVQLGFPRYRFDQVNLHRDWSICLDIEIDFNPISMGNLDIEIKFDLDRYRVRIDLDIEITRSTSILRMPKIKWTQLWRAFKNYLQILQLWKINRTSFNFLTGGGGRRRGLDTRRLRYNVTWSCCSIWQTMQCSERGGEG